MSNITSRNLKFRPVLTLAQIEHISEIMDDSELGKSIKRVMIPMLAKIEVGAINPAYKLSETYALKLSERSERERYENDMMTPEEQLEYENKILGV